MAVGMESAELAVGLEEAERGVALVLVVVGLRTALVWEPKMENLRNSMSRPG